ncbi:MAG TPA: hypothetical protein VJ124_07210 [Pyrinomonadaceae bacterium]|nr:hypothetical protein [Pyrinomonadaceae bacterium]
MQNVATTDSGTYVFDSLQVGTYTVTVEKGGLRNSFQLGMPPMSTSRRP